MGDNAEENDSSQDTAAGLMDLEKDLYLKWFFKAIVAYTVLIMWFAACDIIASAPAGTLLAALFGAVNGKHLPSWMPNIYPYLLTAYGGVREGIRWGKFRHTDTDMIAEAQKAVSVMTRELCIVLFWVGCGAVILIADGLNYITSVPAGFVSMLTQTIVILTGVHVSHSIHKEVMLRRQKAAGLGKFAACPVRDTETVLVEDNVDLKVDQNNSERANVNPAANGRPISNGVDGVPQKPARVGEEHKQMILKFLETNEWINSVSCQKLTGLSDSQTNRLLKSMEEDGELKSDGVTNNKRYKLKKRNITHNLG